MFTTVFNDSYIWQLHCFQLLHSCYHFLTVVMKASIEASDTNNVNHSNKLSPESSAIIHNNNIVIEFKQHSDKYFYATLTDRKLKPKKTKKKTLDVQVGVVLDKPVDSTVPMVTTQPVSSSISIPSTPVITSSIQEVVILDSSIKTLILQNKFLHLSYEHNNKEEKDIDRAMRRLDASSSSKLDSSRVSKKMSTRRIIASCLQSNMSIKEK